MTPARDMWTRRAIWVLAATAVALLALGLPSETFFVGDPGVKLIAARNALAHPASPLDIPLPSIDGATLPYVEPFFVVHGSHAHAVTSEIFPLISAPLIGALGVRGAYLVPGLGLLLAIWACIRLAVLLDGRRSEIAVGLAAALGTPLMFYGLEYWEHAPAVGLAALATVWLLSATEGGRAFAAGLLFGLATLFRPEAFWFFAAVVAASRLLSAAPRRSAVVLAATGAAVAVAPLVLYSAVHFGTIVPPHVGAHATLLTTDWFRARAAIFAAWFLPGRAGITPLWGIVLLAAVASIGAGPDRQGRRFLAAVLVVNVAMVLLTAPNDGGGQWGPRYLLFAFVPGAILVADALRALSRTHAAGTMAAVVLIAGAVWIARSGYRELRGAKLTYGRVLDLVRAEVASGGYAITDLWWLDQVAAAATGDRTILFAATPADRAAILEQLRDGGAATVTAFFSRDESPVADAWTRAACYDIEGRTEISARGLTALRLRRTSGCSF
jgi:hypothetical protein